MDRAARHDLRHPIATISMIASAVAEFGDELDEQTLEEYGAQISRELASLEELLEQHGRVLDPTELAKRGRSFVESAGEPRTASALDAECQRLLKVLARRGGADAGA